MAPGGPSNPGEEERFQCRADADCGERAYGTCRYWSEDGPGDTIAGCRCMYSCRTDTDCDEGNICLGTFGIGNTVGSNGLGGAGGGGGIPMAPTGQGECAPSNCTTNVDCESGECAVGVYTIALDCGGNRIVGGRCRTPADQCRVADDCGDRGDTCDFVRNEAATCDHLEIVGCGRPLMVADEIRTAQTVERRDWTADVSPRLEGLDGDTRRHLADYWLSIAQLEHASVASFSRFSLQMMALGAPADILRDAQAATTDEIEHARLAYGLAGTYGGRPVGPAAYDLTDVSWDMAPESILGSLIEEACFGEILGTAEANACAELATDPVVRDVYLRIAQDEADHAALAWRTLKWLLGQHPELKVHASSALRVAIESHFRRPPAQTMHLPAYGVLGTEERRVLHHEVLEAVVIPCAEAAGLDVAYVV